MDLIVKLTRFKRDVIWDSLTPDGQPRRMLDISRARDDFGFKAKTSFEKSLKNKIKWYKEKKNI